MNFIKFFIFLFIFGLMIIFSASAFTRLGVGVGLGKMQIDKPLKPGEIGMFPSVPVLNTGDEPSEYTFRLAYLDAQPQLRPKQEWFTFDPLKFFLKPGESKLVTVKIAVPLKAAPGDYFAFLEASPIQNSAAGLTTIGIAAATKMYFTVIPANIWQALTHRVSTFWTMHAPWTWIILATIISVIALVILRRTVSFQLGIKRR